MGDLKSLADQRRAMLNKSAKREVARIVTSAEDLLQVEEWIEMPPFFHKSVGGKGFPVGHLTQLVGESDTGKTTLAMLGMVQTQKAGGQVYLIDSEHKFSFQRFALMGGDPEAIVTLSVDNLEEGWTACRDVVEMERAIKKDNPETPPGFLLWDAIASSVSDKIIESEAEDAHVAVDAKINNMEVRKLKKPLRESGLAAVFINHTYMTMPRFGYSKKVVKGGSELFYLSTLILETKKIKKLTREFTSVENKYGIEAKIEVFKGHLGNAMAYPFYVVTRGILDNKADHDKYKAFLKGKSPDTVDQTPLEEILGD